MEPATLYPRYAEGRLVEALTDTPVVLLHGPRQSGKTTLAQVVGQRLGHAYLTFDDPITLGSAQADPVGFFATLPDRVILDEVQRIPELFAVMKAAIDRRREPGRFILTGSANVLLLPRLADSLAGRMEVLRLHPLAQSELTGRRSRFLEGLQSGELPTRTFERLGPELAERVAAGGYPAALLRRAPHRRMAWYREYVEALVQRDVRDLARIGALEVLPRLLAHAATSTAQLFNATDLAAPFQQSRPTIRDYLTLLERVFLLDLLPPWHTNRTSRLLKSPKLHLGDTGLASALLGLDATALLQDRTTLGPLLETFVFQELRRQTSWSPDPPTFHHFRDKDGAEVDIVLESRTRSLIGIEVKASATVTTKDFRGLHRLAALAGDRFTAGVVLYDGERVAGFGDRLYAVPIRCLWETN